MLEQNINIRCTDECKRKNQLSEDKSGDAEPGTADDSRWVDQALTKLPQDSLAYIPVISYKPMNPVTVIRLLVI